MFDDLLARLQPELSAATAPFDPRDPAHQSAVTALVDRLLTGEPAPAHLAGLERDLMEQQDVPVAWIDSEAASTTTGLQPYLTMLQKVAAMYRRYLPTEPGATTLADFLDGLTPDQWLYLSEHVPEAIAQRDPAKFDRFREVTVADLERVLSRDADTS